MIRKLALFVGGIGGLIGFIWLFGQPKRELQIVFKRGTPKAAPKPPLIGETTPRPLAPGPRKLTLRDIRKALLRAGRKPGKGFQKLGKLPTGEQLVGLSDGKKPNEHRLPGKYVMIQDRKKGWKPFLGGVSIYQIRSAKTGWVAALTAENQLVLRSPQGKILMRQDRVGLNPRFSPDGRHLVYIHKQSIAHHTLLWRDIQTGKQHALASRGPMSDPVISPQNDAVIYASGTTGIVSLWKVTRDGQKTQLTNVGMTPGGGRPKGFIPPPTGRYPVLWAKHWLVYDAGEGLWAIRDDGTQAHQIVAGNHRPTWDIPGVSVVYFLNGQRMTATLPAHPSQ